MDKPKNVMNFSKTKISTKNTLIPWRSVDEFSSICELIFQDDKNAKKIGIARLISWNSRYKKLPVAILCTKDLTELQLQVAENGHSNQFQMACTLAITRFVNLHTEEQQKSGRGIPVHEIASKIGLPKWIVDIRHQGTHGHMPQRHVLESALNFSLDWLKKTFWDAHVKEMEGSADRGFQDFDVQTQEKIWKVLGDYMDCMVNADILLNGRPRHKEREILQKLNKPLRNYASKNYLAYLLTQDGYLVPTPDQEKVLGIDNGMDSLQSDHLPTALVHFWSALLDHVHPSGLEHLIMDCIINQLSKLTSENSSDQSKDSPVVRYLLGWAKTLMKRNGVMSTSDPAKRDSPPEKRNKRAASEWSKTLKKCIKKPNIHSMELIPGLLKLQEPRLEKTAEEYLIKLAKAIVHGPNGISYPSNGLPSLDDMEAMIEAGVKRKHKIKNPMLDLLSAGKRGAQDRTSVDSMEPWHVSKDLVDWSRTPLGVLPWQPEDPDFFQLSMPTSSVRKRKSCSSDPPE